MAESALAARGRDPAPLIAVVIPCYRETAHILEVLTRVGSEVRHIVVVDDACPDRTGDHVRTHCRDPRVEVITHARNTGVGGATLTGYRRALEIGADVIVKVDGDGQMDPRLIGDLVGPVINNVADYAKGNRFHHLANLTEMPAVRVFGNLVLSFMTKFSSGYWGIFDPTNGFTAIHATVARQLPLDRIETGYFFESDMLFHLNMARAVVADVPMTARYGDEDSKLHIHRVAPTFIVKHAFNAARRILYAYFLRDFNIASVELVLGLCLLSFGAIFGTVHWFASIQTGVPATAGTVILAALPIILGTQFILAFLNFDIQNVPRTPMHLQLGAGASHSRR